MPSVDNRIVRMQFDNATFERNIQTTLDSLKKLNESLKMQGANKGLQDINTASKKVDLSSATNGLHGVTKGLGEVSTAAKNVTVDTGSISKGIEGVSKGFIAMGAVAVSAISSITTGALTTGLNAARSTVATITDGFSEYETNLNSIQTVLANTASKGTNLDQVNAALNKLNIYSDQTIYNFGEMARNIGTFTAAGVDLDSSVNSIKGIANLAALSGSNADQASSAMYQLSQAMAAGTLKAQDWISVVNSGMGGEIFQSSLFETAKAFKTIKNVPLGETFQDWKKKGGNFKQAMSDGVFTAQVLGATLEGFTGDLSKQQLVAKGYTAQQADAIMKTAVIAKNAATQVKTFTQLIGTVKEAIGTGWADTFGIVLGTFNEAKDTFTNLNTVIGGFVSKVSNARNKVLKDWKKLGGRTELFRGLISAFVAFGLVLKQIKDAFRTLFPRKTGKELYALTHTFANFAHALIPSQETMKNLRRIFTGLFAILKIGTTVISSVVKLFVTLGRALLGVAGPGFLAFAANIADFFTNLAKFLVGGGGITDFFNGLTDVFLGFVPIVQKAIDFISKLFKTLFGGAKSAGSGAKSGIQSGVESIGNGLSKLEPLTARIQNRFDNLKEVFKKIGSIFATVGKAIGQVVSSLWDKISGAFNQGNFNNVLDLVNVGLLSGLLLLFKKFINKGLKIDLFGGLTEKIGGTFDALTSTLKSMQIKVKAEAIMKIAEALAVLTASLVVLSLIDSAALTKSLVAMGVAMTQLVTTLGALDKLQIGPKTAFAFGIIALGMVALAVAMTILAGATKKLGGLDWGQLLKGLTAIAALLTALVVAAKYMKNSAKDMIEAGTGLLIMSVALFLLAKSTSAFAGMNLGDIAKGFVSVSVGLIALAGALHAMPEDKKLPGKQLILTGVALKIFASAIKSFAAISWPDLVKGFTGFGLALAGIVVAMRNMPSNMTETAAQFIALGIAINLIAYAIKQMGGMGLGELATGLIAIAAAVAVLAIAANAMTGALAGAAAMLVVAASLIVLATALKAMSSLDWGTIGGGLLKIAIVLAAFALAALALQPALPALIGLGIALGLIGIGFAAIGIGAYAVAKAFEVFGRVGPKAFDNFKKAMKALAAILPDLFRGFAEGLIEMVKMVLKAAPSLISGLAKLFGALLDAIVLIIPKLQIVLAKLIMAGMATIRALAAEYIKTGFFILIHLLQGISDNIGEIVTLGGQIATNFANALGEHAGDFVGAGLKILLGLVQGVVSNIGQVITAVVQIVTTIIQQLAAAGVQFIQAGVSVIVQFLEGIANSAQSIINAGADIIVKIIQGFTGAMTKIGGAIRQFIEALKSEFGKNVRTIIDAGVYIVGVLLDAIVNATDVITTKVIAFINKLAGVVRAKSKPLADAFYNLGTAIIDGIIDGIGDGIKLAEYIVKKLAEHLPGPLKAILGIHSPSTAFYDIGVWAMKGLGNGLVEGGKKIVNGIGDTISNIWDSWSPSRQMISLGENFASGLGIGMDNKTSEVEKSAAAMAKSLLKVTENLMATDEFNPVITPVIDLTKVAADAKLIKNMLPDGTIVAGQSLVQANVIASTSAENAASKSENSPGGSSDIKFEQNIYAPEQLSMATIYKQTRNQITMAKEELKIR